jgi:hypothetical protein
LEVELATAPVTAAIGGVLAQRWRDAAPATWNRHLATVRSFARYWQRNGLLDIDGDIVLDRRAEKHDQTRSIPLASLERLWERHDVALRERTLWRPGVPVEPAPPAIRARASEHPARPTRPRRAHLLPLPSCSGSSQVPGNEARFSGDRRHDLLSERCLGGLQDVSVDADRDKNCMHVPMPRRS